MFKNSQLLPYFPWIELTHKNGTVVDLCAALTNRDARLYFVSDKSPDGIQMMDRPQWYFDFKHSSGNTRTIEILQEQAEEISASCGCKIETFEDGIFWF